MSNNKTSGNAKNKNDIDLSSSQNISDSVISKSNVSITHHHHYSKDQDQSEKDKYRPKLKRKISDELIGKLLNEKVVEFNSKIKDEAGMANMIEGKTKTICICITGGDNYASVLENLRLEDFYITDDTSADLRVTASSEILEALMSKTMSPVKAYMKGNLKVKASLMDMLLLKKLF